jgi:hypothetical protein
MRELETEILAAGEVRWSLTPKGDLRGDIAFQHDVNALLARVEQWQMPWRSISDISPAAPPNPIVADATPLPVAVRRPIGQLSPIVVTAPLHARARRR